MTCPTNPAVTLQQATNLVISAANDLYEVINGLATEEVTLCDSQVIPTLRKALLDNFYFLPAIPYVAGVDATEYNQLYTYTDYLIYAPAATVSNPITAPANPLDSGDWQIFSGTGSSIEQQPRVVADGVTTVYDSPASSLQPARNFIVTLDGVKQDPVTDYDVLSNGDIEFTVAPEEGVAVDIIYFKNITIVDNQTGLYAQQAQDAADEAEASALSAASNANFKGEWSTLTGAYSKGITVSESGIRYLLKVDLADITTSQPSLNPNDWDALNVHNVLGGRDAADAHPATSIGLDSGDTVQEHVNKKANREALAGRAVFKSTADLLTGTSLDGVISDATFLALVGTTIKFRTEGFYVGSTDGSAEYKLLNAVDSTAAGYIDGVSRFQIRGLDVYGCVTPSDGVFNCESFGVSTTATATANKNAINEAIKLQLNILGGGRPTIGAGIFEVDGTIVARRKVVLVGQGDLPTEIKLANNSNVDLCKSENYDSLTGTNATTANSLCPYSFGFENVQLNGNADNQTAGAGVRFYGPRLILDKLMVYNTYDHCMYTEYSDQIGSSDPEGQEEGDIGSVICRNSKTGMGWLFRGPHNSVINNLICAYNADWGFRNERSSGNYDGNITLINHLHTYANGNSGVDDKEAYFGAVTSIDYWIIDGGYGVIADNDCQINMIKLIFGGQSNHGVIIEGDHNNIGMMNGSMLSGTSGFDVLRIEGNNNYVGRARLNGLTSGANNHDGVVILGTGNTVADLNARECVRGCVITGGLNTVKGKLLNCTDSFSYSTPTGTHLGKNDVNLQIYQTTGNYTIGNPPVADIDNFTFVATGQGNKFTKINILSDQIDMDTTAAQSISIPHNLLYKPLTKDISLTLIESSPSSTAYELAYLRVGTVDATNVSVQFKLSVAAPAGTKARIGIKTGN